MQTITGVVSISTAKSFLILAHCLAWRSRVLTLTAALVVRDGELEIVSAVIAQAIPIHIA